MSEKSELLDKEREFHDGWASEIDPKEVKVLETFSLFTSPEPQWILSQFGTLRGKKVLELGSGAGEGAVFFALQGAEVTATDYAPGMLDVVERVAKFHGVKVQTVVCSAEELSVFDSESFDIVYAANLLHHVDIEKCLDEVKRVLKPGGIAGFWDPLDHNPVIGVYRRMAVEVRTEDEHPIRREQMLWFSSRFSTLKKRFFWFTALLVFVKFYWVDRIHPNDDRYWKRILTHADSLKNLYKPLAFLDRGLLTLFPFLGWWCWNIGIVVIKDGTSNTQPSTALEE